MQSRDDVITNFENAFEIDKTDVVKEVDSIREAYIDLQTYLIKNELRTFDALREVKADYDDARDEFLK